MDGVHDLGGKQNFGRVPHNVNEYPNGPFQTAEFHEDWEYLGYALLFAGAEAGKFNLDELRHAVERMEPRDYMTTPYFERYIVGTASLMVEKGVLSQSELEKAAGGAFPLARPTSEGIAPRSGARTFNVGDRVRVRANHVRGHTRCPAYCFGKEGVVTHRTSHTWPLPDSAGHGRADAGSEPTYHVEFDATELFGPDTDARKVVIDLFENYLEPA